MRLLRRVFGPVESRITALRSNRERTTGVYWALWGIIVVLYLAWPLTHLDAYHWTNDEGLYMQRAVLANTGYPLYTEVYLNKPPLLVWILQLAFRVAGPRVAVARLAALCLTLVGLVAAGMVTTQLWGRWAGLVAAGILLGLPEVPVRAHAVMADLPAHAFALVAMGAALLFRRSGRRGWIALSGAAFTGALLIHPLLIYTALPLTLSLVLPGLGTSADKPSRKTGWLDVLIFMGTAAILGMLMLAAVDRRHFFQWVFEFNYGAGSDLLEPQKNWDRIIGYLNDIWPLAWLAVLSVVTLSVAPGKRRPLLVVFVWWLATATILMTSSPLQKQYLVFMAFPMAIVAGGGLATVGRWALDHIKGERRLKDWCAVLALLMFVGVVLFVVDRWEDTRPYLAVGPEWSPDHLAARTYLETQFSSGTFVATDDPMLAFAAGQLVPPSLTELSTKQIKVGNLATDDARGSILWYGVKAVLFSTGRLERLPGLEDWIASVATERHDFGELRAYRLDLPRSVPSSAISLLGNEIELRGYALSSAELRPGDTLTVMLLWEAKEAVSMDYHVFVHLEDEENRSWGQHDGPPGRGDRPTHQWMAGQRVFDTHVIAIDPEALPGKYHLLVGMYGWPSLERLPAFRPDGSRWPDDRITLAEVEIVAP